MRPKKITPAKLVWGLLAMLVVGAALFPLTRRYPDQTFFAVFILILGGFLADGLLSDSIAFGRLGARRISKTKSPIGYWCAVTFYTMFIGFLAFCLFTVEFKSLR